MGRDRGAWDLLAAKLSTFERNALLVGVFSVVAAIGMAFGFETTGGSVRFMGLAGLLALLICASSRGIRLYRAGIRAALPTSVGRTRVRIRPSRGFGVLTVALAIVLPLAAVVAVLILVEWAWLPVAGVLLVGCAGMWTTWTRNAVEAREYSMSSDTASGLLQRLCIVADIPVPEVVVEHDVVSTAWTARGRIHLTSPLLELLDDRELEAVLAHEVAHLARRDAAVMEICSAPSRVMLSFATFLTPRLGRWTWEMVRHGGRVGILGAGAMWMLAVLCVPPAFVLGWIARVSVLAMSRAREFAADAAAVTLTGSPSALASALLKLEHQAGWAPSFDLRRLEQDAVLRIVGPARSRLGRLFSTHPVTAARTDRLQALERRLRGA